MKTTNKSIVVILLSLFLFGFQLSASKETQNNGAKIKLSEESYDFGKILEGSVVNHIFTVTNVGDSVLNIHKLRGS